MEILNLIESIIIYSLIVSAILGPILMFICITKNLKDKYSKKGTIRLKDLTKYLYTLAGLIPFVGLALACSYAKDSFDLHNKLNNLWNVSILSTEEYKIQERTKKVLYGNKEG